ncbi:hypothetical protein GCM10011487_17540 [Steroidobacter agaridevorans]|uniref:Uncharacterized protein n=1 Tax=Steroidobacter agaridevorans TaxID=2695856 RepID=A0A829Y8V7_9GAMM|nr:hypothetical protein [Steroidobacter agaridevorans]GFE79754.1 hypothetical protein GCM10011487_17540 [Steroidobacter agaridevorans]GFE90702.1 hypothetical protein GCM10011488_56560 [Steroidobacter agaridevorans]
MVFKAAVVFIAGGLMGSGIVALTRPDDGAETLSAEFHKETNRQGYVQASFAAQRPFAALGPVTRQ